MGLLPWLFGAQLLFSCTGTYDYQWQNNGVDDKDHASTTASFMLDIRNEKWRFTPALGRYVQMYQSLDDTPPRHCDKQIEYANEESDSLCKTFKENIDTVEFRHRLVGNSRNGSHNDEEVSGTFNRVSGALEMFHEWQHQAGYDERSGQSDEIETYEMNCVKADKLF